MSRTWFTIRRSKIRLAIIFLRPRSIFSEWARGASGPTRFWITWCAASWWCRRITTSRSGDNRDRSLDSRYWGFVDRNSIMGRPMLVYWSVRSVSADYSDRGLYSTLYRMLDTLRHLGARTRWHRLFHTVH